MKDGPKPSLRAVISWQPTHNLRLKDIFSKHAIARSGLQTLTRIKTPTGKDYSPRSDVNRNYSGYRCLVKKKIIKFGIIISRHLGLSFWNGEESRTEQRSLLLTGYFPLIYFLSKARKTASNRIACLNLVLLAWSVTFYAVIRENADLRNSRLFDLCDNFVWNLLSLTVSQNNT